MGNSQSKLAAPVEKEGEAYRSLQSAMRAFSNGFEDSFVTALYDAQRPRLIADVLQEMGPSRSQQSYDELLDAEKKLYHKIQQELGLIPQDGDVPAGQSPSSPTDQPPASTTVKVDNFDDGAEADDESGSGNDSWNSQLPPYSYFAQNPPPTTFGGVARRLSALLSDDETGFGQPESRRTIVTNGTYFPPPPPPPPTYGDPIYAAAVASDILPGCSPISPASGGDYAKLEIVSPVSPTNIAAEIAAAADIAAQTTSDQI